MIDDLLIGPVCDCRGCGAPHHSLGTLPLALYYFSDSAGSFDPGDAEHLCGTCGNRRTTYLNRRVRLQRIAPCDYVALPYNEQENDAADQGSGSESEEEKH